MSKVKEIPKLPEINLPSFNDVKVSEEDIAKLLVKVYESTKSSVMRKVQNTHQAVKERDVSLKLIPTATILMRFRAPGVYRSIQILLVSEGQAFIDDDAGNLVRTDVNGTALNAIKYQNEKFGCHSLSKKGERICLNKIDNCIYKFKAYKKKPILITEAPRGIVSTIYCSPSDGDLLVGMESPGRVIRYKKKGQEVHQIQYDNTGKSLYEIPIYITENQINRDVCVSDHDRDAVVVVNRDGHHRFSYTGHTQKSGLWPTGISTDTQGHILVIDLKSQTVQIINREGKFLSFLLTTEQGIKYPVSLSLDVGNNLVGRRQERQHDISIHLRTAVKTYNKTVYNIMTTLI